MTTPTVALGVCGSIACYKAAYLCRLLREDGVNVRVLMTPAAEEFVGAATFRALTGNAVIRGGGGGAAHSADGMDHIAAAREADLMLVAPASADFLAKAAGGYAESAVLAAFLAADCPKWLAPAMNRQMWLAPPTQRNIRALAADGCGIIGPAAGEQACGEIGEGRMSEPEEIRAAVRLALRAPLRGLRVVVSTGATVAAIDTMRVISNRSSGRMGFAVAAACREAGADVTVVAGNTAVPPPPILPPAALVRAASNAAMRDALMTVCADADVFVSAAAVADFRPRRPLAQKPPRGKGLTLELRPAADILAEVGKRFPKLYTIAFAALDGDGDGDGDRPPVIPAHPVIPAKAGIQPGIQNRPGIWLDSRFRGNDKGRENAVPVPEKWRTAAKRKMRAKNADAVIANSVADADGEDCRLVLFSADGGESPLPRMAKSEAGREIARFLAANVSRETSAGNAAAAAADSATGK